MGSMHTRDKRKLELGFEGQIIVNEQFGIIPKRTTLQSNKKGPEPENTAHFY